MANEQNLMKGDAIHKFTPEEAAKGGRASGEAKRRRKTFKEAIQILLETEVKDKNGNKSSIQDIGLVALAEKLMEGDLATFIAFRDTIGEKPVDRVEQETTNVIKVDVTDE